MQNVTRLNELLRVPDYGKDLISNPNGCSSSCTTLSSPTATTVERAAGKYFFATALTSAAVVLSILSLSLAMLSGGRPSTQRLASSPASPAPDCNPIASIPTRLRLACVISV